MYPCYLHEIRLRSSTDEQVESDCNLCSELRNVFNVEEELRKHSQAFSSAMKASKRKRSFPIASVVDWKTLDQNEECLNLDSVHLKDVCTQWKKDLVEKRMCQHRPSLATHEAQSVVVDSKPTPSNSIVE